MTKNATKNIFKNATATMYPAKVEVNFNKFYSPDDTIREELSKAEFHYWRQVKDGHNSYFWGSKNLEAALALIKKHDITVKVMEEEKAPAKRVKKSDKPAKQVKKTSSTKKAAKPSKKVSKKEVEKANEDIFWKKMAGLAKEAGVKMVIIG